MENKNKKEEKKKKKKEAARRRRIIIDEEAAAFLHSEDHLTLHRNRRMGNFYILGKTAYSVCRDRLRMAVVGLSRCQKPPLTT